MRRGVRGAAVLALSLAAWLVAAGPAGAAVIDVDTTADSVADDGFCSLREAVTATNTNVPVNGADDCDHDMTAGTDTIRLADGMAYPIASTDADPVDDNLDGDFDVEPGAGGLEIEGGGHQGGSASVIDANQMSRALDVTGSTGVLTLRDLRVEDGLDDGDEGGPPGGGGVGVSTGGVGKGLVLDRVTVTGSQTTTGSGGGIHTRNPSSLSITEGVISSNIADGVSAAGGIFAQAGLTLTDSEVTNNQATEAAAIRGGGGIRVSGAAISTITGSTIGDNTAAGGGGGGIVRADGGGLEIRTSTISNNHALGNTGHGGGVRFTGAGTGDLLIEDSTLAGNDAVGTGGGLSHAPQTTGTTLTVRRTAIVGNTLAGLSSGSAARGGGIVSGGINNPGLTLIEDAVVEANTIEGDGDDSGGGAGLAFDAITESTDYTVRRSTIAGNGGGVAAAALTEMQGGGLFASSENSLTVVNSTISGNDGGDAPTVQGGGLYVSQTPATVVHSTFTGNIGDGTRGHAMRAVVDNIDVRGTVVDNSTNACSEFVGGTITSQGYNLDASTSCGFTGTGDAQSTPALLGALQDNGGPGAGFPGSLQPIETHAPALASEAVDHVPSAACIDEPGPGPLTVDQRDLPRPDDGDNNMLFDCEAGSVELQESGPPLVAPDVVTQAASAITPTSATLNGTVDANGAAANCEFEYVDDAEFQMTGFMNPSTVDCVPNPIGGDVVTPVSAAIAGLAPGTLYHSRVSATNGGGLDEGLDEQFTTLAAPASPPALPPAQPGITLPSNGFEFGKLKRKKKKGIAFLIVFVPGPGEVGLKGKGIKNRGLAATATKSVSTDGGRVKLKVKPAKKGKKARKLRQRLRFKGKAKVKVFVSYLPTGGTINTQRKKVKLVRR